MFGGVTTACLSVHRFESITMRSYYGAICNVAMRRVDMTYGNLHLDECIQYLHFYGRGAK